MAVSSVVSPPLKAILFFLQEVQNGPQFAGVNSRSVTEIDKWGQRNPCRNVRVAEYFAGGTRPAEWQSGSAVRFHSRNRRHREPCGVPRHYRPANEFSPPPKR
jgi:hypothetical protein